MNLRRYDFSVSATHLDYEFESTGPNGRIRKVVRFSPQNANGVTYFNLGFGDLDEKTGLVDDLSVSDNRDREKILATIASIVLDFITRFPDVIVYAQGSTLSRTRLYQIGIGKYWNEIETILRVYGFSNGKWVSFEKNINFQAFLVIRK